MPQWFRKYFVPHPENDHRPHILRSDITIFFLWVTLLSELVFLFPVLGVFTQSDFFAAILPSVLIDSANDSRQFSYVGKLRNNPLLEEAARRKANDMVTKGYFAHVSPTGIDPWYWLKDVGYNFTNAGENLAVNFVDSSDVHTAWMNSSGHRANILSSKFTEIGIATATGTYKGNPTVFVVQFFGTPAQKVMVAAAPQPVIYPTPKTSPIIVPSSPPTTLVSAGQAEGTFVEVTQEADTDSSPIHQESRYFERFISQPRTLLNDILGSIFVIVSLALLITLVGRFEFQHHPTIINGLAVVAVITAIFLFNQHFTALDATIL